MNGDVIKHEMIYCYVMNVIFSSSMFLYSSVRFIQISRTVLKNLLFVRKKKSKHCRRNLL